MISVHTCGSALLLRVTGAADACDAVALRNAIACELEDASCCHVVVDVTGATRLSWRSLAVLVDAQALLVRGGGDLRVVVADDTTVREGDLARLFHLHGSVEEALAASAAS